MNTSTSIAFHSGALIPHRTHRRGKNNDSRTFPTKIGTIAEGVVHTLGHATSGSSEKFYEDHVTAIFMALYAEVALGPLLGALAISLYSHWAM